MEIFDTLELAIALADFGVFVLFPAYLGFRIYYRRKLKRLGVVLPFYLALFLYLAVLGYSVFLLPPLLRFQVNCCSPEAKANLGALFTSEVAYFGEHNTYAGGERAFELMDWTPVDNSYNYFCGEDRILSETWEKTSLNYGDILKGPSVTRDSFTCLALGNIDQDPFVDVWIMTDAKQLVKITNDEENRFLHPDLVVNPDLPIFRLTFSDRAAPYWAELNKKERIATLVYLALLIVFIFVAVKEFRGYVRLIGEAKARSEDDGSGSGEAD